MSFDEITQKNVDAWLKGNFSEPSKEELKKLIQKKPDQVIDSFYTRMAFGTGGLRGLMGIGTNRMNEYTVAAATQGLANYINSQQAQNRPSVLIGHDSRHLSSFFAEIAARVLAANEIQVYLYKELRPVPMVSFGCREKKCISAIMITASHNPPEYNGYKVYWDDGAQVLPPHDTAIIKEVNQVPLDQAKMLPNLESSLISWIGDELDSLYLEQVRKLQFLSNQNKEKGKELKIIYTPIHGAGITMVPKILKDWGFENVQIVPEQEKPDGSFPTVKKPNPEEKEALQLGLNLLESEKADLLMGTDPDSDRIGLAVMHQCKAVLLSGNETACLCAYHIAKQLQKSGKSPANGAMVKTIVTSELFKKIAESQSYTCFDVLTGFKYIGQWMRNWEKDHKHTFLFGAEESYGYLMGTHARDKDAVIMAALVSEIALDAKLSDKTLIDLLHDIYRQEGLYRELLTSLVFPDTKETKEKLKKMMASLRENPPREFAGIKVKKVEDYQTSKSIDLESGKETALALPESNVLLFWLEDASKLVIRPSGTEPKVKIYCGVCDLKEKDIEKGIKALDSKLQTLTEAIKKLIH